MMNNGSPGIFKDSKNLDHFVFLRNRIHCHVYALRGLGFSVCLLIISLTSGLSQACFDADFESGTVQGYTSYLGTIDDNGKVVIDDPGPDSSQHRLFHVSEGFDPIAATHCDTFKMLPVVPEGGGQYALRLGNALTGAQAARIVLHFTVTEDVTFFLLKYAAVLNDPGHEHFEQPRFELRIKNKEGDVFPCGTYTVRAEEGIPGFENCGEWRVLPWTSLGIELQSYLGQEIQIEILTTDCSRGRHAGYAYIDATCQPLSMDVEGACPGNSTANIRVTEGFANYKWNTGATSNEIEIENPIPGTAYAVTVTSATGCVLVLRDTIPAFVDQAKPRFDAIQDTIACAEERFWIRPKGDHLHEIYNVEFGYAADSFLIFAQEDASYTFYGYNEFRCQSDTLIYNLKIIQDNVTAVVEDVRCYNNSDGAITLNDPPQGQFVSYSWSNGASEQNIQNARAGEYIVTAIDSMGCAHSGTFKIDQPAQLSIRYTTKEVSCFEGDDGRIALHLVGGNGPFKLESRIIESRLDTIAGLKAGTYELAVSDANGCMTSEIVTISEPPLLLVETIGKPASCFQGSDGSATALATGGSPPYLFSWNDDFNQQGQSASNMKAGTYEVLVIDKNGCLEIRKTIIEEPEELTVEIIIDSIACYGGEDGGITAFVEGGIPNYSFQWAKFPQEQSEKIENLSAGDYDLIIKDQNDCPLERTIRLTAPDPITISSEAYLLPDCNANIGGRTIIKTAGGKGNHHYFWETGDDSNMVESFIPGMKWVHVVDENGCSHLDSVKIIWPEVSVEMKGLTTDFGYTEQFVCLGDEIELSMRASREVSRVVWETPFPTDCPDCMATSGIPGETFTYVVRAVDETGCHLEKEGAVLVVEDCGTYIPNVFTPNGDNENDMFYVVASSGSAKIEKMEVYNRWGNLMYSGSNLEVGNPDDGWDGTTSTGVASVGVYIYMIEISFLDIEKPVVFSGDVLLKR